MIKVVDKQLFINGNAVHDASYALHKDPNHISPFDETRMAARDNFGPFTVPPRSYFCMGDNRDNSLDSRFWQELPASYLLGRTFAIYWSYGGSTADGAWHGVGAKLLDLEKTVVGFFPDTRWDRTFKIVR